MAERLPEHPAWWTALGTGLGYVLILGVMVVLLFLIPYLVFRFA